jgi:hypothetical protein
MDCFFCLKLAVVVSPHDLFAFSPHLATKYEKIHVVRTWRSSQSAGSWCSSMPGRVAQQQQWQATQAALKRLSHASHAMTSVIYGGCSSSCAHSCCMQQPKD